MTGPAPRSRRTALVTGASRGLGRAVAAAPAADGMQVRAGVRDTAAGEAVAARPVLHLATLPRDGPTGGFLQDGEPQPG